MRKALQVLATTLNGLVFLWLAKAVVELLQKGELGRYGPPWALVFFCPLLNVIGSSGVLKGSLGLAAAVGAVGVNSLLLLGCIFMLLWPLGHLGHGWALVGFWTYCAAVALAEIALIARTRELARG